MLVKKKENIWKDAFFMFTIALYYKILKVVQLNVSYYGTNNIF